MKERLKCHTLLCADDLQSFCADDLQSFSLSLASQKLYTGKSGIPDQNPGGETTSMNPTGVSASDRLAVLNAWPQGDARGCLKRKFRGKSCLFGFLVDIPDYNYGEFEGRSVVIVVGCQRIDID